MPRPADSKSTPVGDTGEWSTSICVWGKTASLFWELLTRSPAGDRSPSPRGGLRGLTYKAIWGDCPPVIVAPRESTDPEKRPGACFVPLLTICWGTCEEQWRRWRCGWAWMAPITVQRCAAPCRCGRAPHSLSAQRRSRQLALQRWWPSAPRTPTPLLLALFRPAPGLLSTRFRAVSPPGDLQQTQRRFRSGRPTTSRLRLAAARSAKPPAHAVAAWLMARLRVRDTDWTIGGDAFTRRLSKAPRDPLGLLALRVRGCEALCGRGPGRERAPRFPAGAPRSSAGDFQLRRSRRSC
jgi:hypothetical protein